MAVKAIFFDIDGTLVSFKTHRVTESNVRVLKALREKGIKVFISTGRMVKMTGVLDGLQFDGYVANNGATCYDKDKKMLFGRRLPKSQLEAIYKRLKDTSLPQFPLSFMCSDNYYLNRQSDVAEEIARVVGVAPPVVLPLEEIIEKDVYQMCIYLRGRELDELMRDWLTGCTASVWNPLFADVNETGVTKAYGIDKMLELFKIDLKDTLSFGDGGNDIPMLEHTAISVCMGNATEDVRAASDYITEDVDSDGVAKALLRLGIL